MVLINSQLVSKVGVSSFRTQGSTDSRCIFCYDSTPAATTLRQSGWALTKPAGVFAFV